MTPWLTAEALDSATLEQLEASKYARAFVLALLGVEEQALYEWRPGQRWAKSALELSPAETGPDLWDALSDPELHADPEAWADREAERFLAERQKPEPGP